MRIVVSSLLLVLPLTAAAAKPTVDDACTSLVNIMVDAYKVEVDPFDRSEMRNRCSTSLNAATAKDLKNQLKCAIGATTVNGLLFCGDDVEAARETIKPFGPTMVKACENQAKVSAAFANTELTDALKEKLMAGCMNDMSLQMSFNEPPAMVRKTACMTKAKSQSASERCWE